MVQNLSFFFHPNLSFLIVIAATEKFRDSNQGEIGVAHISLFFVCIEEKVFVNEFFTLLKLLFSSSAYLGSKSPSQSFKNENFLP